MKARSLRSVSQSEDRFEGSEVDSLAAPMGTRVVQADAPEETRSLVAAAPPAVDTLQKAARVLEILEADLPSLSSAEFEQGCAEAGIPKLQQLKLKKLHAELLRTPRDSQVDPSMADDVTDDVAPVSAASVDQIEDLGSILPPPRNNAEPAARDPSGDGSLGEPRTVLVSVGAATETDTAAPRGDDGSHLTASAAQPDAGAHETPSQVTLEDRGIGGACVSCRSTRTSMSEATDLPLSFANIKCDGPTLSITVHKAIHPSCAQKGTPVSLTFGTAAEAEAMQREMDQAIGKANGQHWGISKNFMREQRERWEDEGRRCKGMTVAQYFDNIGHGEVYGAQWAWCADVLARLEAKQEKSAKDLKEIAYYKRKVHKTELYDDMELTDYMNILKERDLKPRNQLVSYAEFIHAKSDSTGRRMVGKATVFVSHVWKMLTKDFFEVCLAEMKAEDYAWIDLYLHNQYQGPVSSIGNENSEYWVTKFGELIGGIGCVVAIVTDWEEPVMLSRIWCLFELNAAIDTRAELRFVATAAEQLDLSINLQGKFLKLGAIVSRIAVQECDAKRPHEIQDKAIFLGKLRGIEDLVNAKLRKEMQRWLAEASEAVLWRTDPYREQLGPAALALEVTHIGEGGNCRRCCRLCCWPIPTGAKATRLIENFPRLSGLLIVLGFLAALFGIGFLILAWDKNTDCLANSPGCHVLAYMFAGAAGCIVVCSALLFSSIPLVQHQVRRQLRNPPLFGAWATRHRHAIFWAMARPGPVGFMLVLILFGFHWAVAMVFGIIIAAIVTFAVSVPLAFNIENAAFRAELAVKVGWLRMKLGEAEAAEMIFRAAHEEVQHMVGTDDPERSFIAAPGLARCMCELGRAEMAAYLVTEVEAAADRNAADGASWLSSVQGCRMNRSDDIAMEWKDRGPLLRARMAAAVRSPDDQVLALLLKAGQTKFGATHCLDDNTPEWTEFLARMAAEGDSPIWQTLPAQMRSAGDNALSPWVKVTHKSRAYYQREAPLERTLHVPAEGVRQEVELGMEGWTNMSDAWESAYFQLGGQGCWTSEQDRKYKLTVQSVQRKARAIKVGRRLLIIGIFIAVLCAIFVYDCGEHSEWGIGSCGTCTDSYVGERCQLAPTYTISGAVDIRYNGPYERLAAVCNGKPVYQLVGVGYMYVLHQSSVEAWEVGETSNITKCDIGAPYLHLWSLGGDCPLSPDGEGCAGLWMEYVSDGDCDNNWCVMPSLVVSPCEEDNPCCGIDCGAHGTLRDDSGSSVPCGCNCADGWTGTRCQEAPLPQLPVGLAEAYVVSGAADSEYNGRYERRAAECSDKPVYQLGEYGSVLYLHGSSWYIGAAENAVDCYCCPDHIRSSGNSGSCAASPDGGGCGWIELIDNNWQDAPSIAVSACATADEPCCGVDCGSHGALSQADAIVIGAPCSCICSDNYLGDRCQLAPAYTISGATRPQLNGLYSRLSAECNDKPIHKMDGSEYILFQPTDRSNWMVGDTADWSGGTPDCAPTGWITSSGNDGWCPTSPDGAGCAGLWREYTDDCGGSSWCDAPSLAVTRLCPEDNPCCNVDCGAHGNLDAGEPCSCSCTDGYSGDRCQMMPLPAGMAESYTISGAPRSQRNGRYLRLPSECNAKPVYQLEGTDYVLFQPTGRSHWMVGSSNRLADCGTSGWISSSRGSCGASPDGAGCAGLWRATTDDCGGSSWCDAPTITVSTP